MSACRVLDSLQKHQLGLIDRMNRRVESMQRMADLIEQAADLKTLVPNPANLIPVSNIDLTLYNDLRNSCPFLNLPYADMDNLLGIDQLRGELNKAYAHLCDQIDSHAALRLDRFKKCLARFQHHMNIDLGKIQGYIRCADGMCHAAENTGAAMGAAGAAVNDYAKNLAAGPSALGNQAIQRKNREMAELKSSIKDMMI